MSHKSRSAEQYEKRLLQNHVDREGYGVHGRPGRDSDRGGECGFDSPYTRTGNSDLFRLNRSNTVNAVSELAGSVASPLLRIDNGSSGTGATALDLQTEPGKPPLEVNSAAKVSNLNADKLDGLDADQLVRATSTPVTDPDDVIPDFLDGQWVPVLSNEANVPNGWGLARMGKTGGGKANWAG